MRWIIGLGNGYGLLFGFWYGLEISQMGKWNWKLDHVYGHKFKNLGMDYE